MSGVRASNGSCSGGPSRPPRRCRSGSPRSSLSPSSPPTPSPPPPTPPRRSCSRSCWPARRRSAYRSASRSRWSFCWSLWPSPTSRPSTPTPMAAGSYVVSRENLGLLPGLVAAASLMVDYVMTVAVSVASGVAAIITAFPVARPATGSGSASGVIILVALANLRGVSESARFFAVPTYAFVAPVRRVWWSWASSAGHRRPAAAADVAAPPRASRAPRCCGSCCGRSRVGARP